MLNREQILERLIDREIFTLCNEFVDYLMRDESGQWVDELVPALDAPDYSEPPVGYEVLKDDNGWYWTDSDGEYENPANTEWEAIEAAWEDSGDEPPRIEALQFFIVSDWLADKLEKVPGALVARDVLGFDIWGRSEYGQSLTLDGDLNRVADMIAHA